MPRNKSAQNNGLSTPAANPLIELVFKPNILGKRLTSVLIQVLLAYSGDLLAEVESEEKRMIDAPDKMREIKENTGTNYSSNNNEAASCK